MISIDLRLFLFVEFKNEGETEYLDYLSNNFTDLILFLSNFDKLKNIKKYYERYYSHPNLLNLYSIIGNEQDKGSSIYILSEKIKRLQDRSDRLDKYIWLILLSILVFLCSKYLSYPLIKSSLFSILCNL